VNDSGLRPPDERCEGEHYWRWVNRRFAGHTYQPVYHQLGSHADSPPRLLGPDGQPIASTAPPPLPFGFAPEAPRG
jgi:hypothetical protein